MVESRDIEFIEDKFDKDSMDALIPTQTQQGDSNPITTLGGTKRIESKVVNSVPYRLVYTILANKLVQNTPLFRTRKNTSCTGEIRLSRPVNGYWAET